jgi:hypothetical protein
MGILDDIINSPGGRKTPKPDPWSGAEDKLEEWLGLAAPGTMPNLGRPAKAPRAAEKAPPEQRKAPKRAAPSPKAPGPAPDPIIKVTVLNHVEEIYLPKFFDDAVEYSVALQRARIRTPGHMKPGFMLTVTIGEFTLEKRIACPIKDKLDAMDSPAFVAGLAQCIRKIRDRISTGKK